MPNRAHGHLSGSITRFALPWVTAFYYGTILSKALTFYNTYNEVWHLWYRSIFPDIEHRRSPQHVVWIHLCTDFLFKCNGLSYYMPIAQDPASTLGVIWILHYWSQTPLWVWSHFGNRFHVWHESTPSKWQKLLRPMCYRLCKLNSSDLTQLSSKCLIFGSQTCSVWNATQIHYLPLTHPCTYGILNLSRVTPPSLLAHLTLIK